MILESYIFAFYMLIVFMIAFILGYLVGDHQRQDKFMDYLFKYGDTVEFGKRKFGGKR